MLVNASSSNDSLLHPFLRFDLQCFMSKPNSIVFLTFIIIIVLLLLPLCIFVIYHGLQQWWKKRSTSSAAAMSHSDSFTYHLVAMEMIGVFGSIIYCCGVYSHRVYIIFVGGRLMSLIWYGQTFFHVLTCVERYLAVVHPVTYLSLRRERGVRIRNVTIGCIWLLSFGGASLVMTDDIDIIVDLIFLSSSLIITSFCSLAVLCVLIRPGPGGQGGTRDRVDQSKQRAFNTIAAILGVLVARFAGDLVNLVLYVLRDRSFCLMMACVFWFNLPSSLVLPLLFLHSRGKVMCCKNNIQRV